MAQCSHPMCHCDDNNVDRAGQKFCSRYCADSATETSLADAVCACGHADCSGSVPA